MPKDLNYERLKSDTTNTTPMNASAEQRESDGVRAAYAAGTTAVFETYVRLDADESGAADVQDWFKVVITPSIEDRGSGLGRGKLTVAITPINGDASEGTTETKIVTHGETVDAWQTAAGRARQA